MINSGNFNSKSPFFKKYIYREHLHNLSRYLFFVREFFNLS